MSNESILAQVRRGVVLAGFYAMFGTGCAHTVYSMEVLDTTQMEISHEVESQCGENCSLDRCWQETGEVIVCDVEFQFTIDSSKREVLLNASEALNSKNMNVGFCGRDSTVTQLVAAFLGGVGGGLAAGVAGGGVSPGSMASISSYNVIEVGSAHQSSDAVIATACASTPEVE